MNFGIIGRGPWGWVWHRQLEQCGHGVLWHRRQDWQAALGVPDGIIIASAPQSHYWLARELIREGAPLIIEKPLCLLASHAQDLLALAIKNDSIVFVDHTRLHSPAWREFKQKALREGVRSFYAQAGGGCKLDPLWDWGSHLVAMGLDLGVRPEDLNIRAFAEDVPLQCLVNDRLLFSDPPASPAPLEVLISEFCEAIEKGEQNIDSLRLGVKVVEILEALEALKAPATQVAEVPVGA